MTKDEAKKLYYELHEMEMRALRRQALDARHRLLEQRLDLGKVSLFE